MLCIDEKSYHFSGNLVDISKFDPHDLKLDKKKWKDLDIYYINYVNKNKSIVDNVGLLYLLINKVFGYLSEENGERFLTIREKNNEKYDRVLSVTKSGITSKEGKEIVYDKECNKNKFSSYTTNLPLEKLMYFPTLTVIIRCAIKRGELFYPQAYLEDCYYKNMIAYERIDKSEGIDFNKGENSVKCMICNYYYFKDIGFKYQPYVCNGFHDFSMTIQNLSDFFVVTIKNVDYGIYITGVDNKAAVNILNNSNLNNKSVL